VVNGLLCVKANFPKKGVYLAYLIIREGGEEWQPAQDIQAQGGAAHSGPDNRELDWGLSAPFDHLFFVAAGWIAIEEV